MAKTPKQPDDERNPEEAARARDAILKRMLQTKPKQQKDLMAERKKKRGSVGRSTE
jgi:membrane carboxypeptidase/penicillin-binding protein PbpC